MRNVDAGYGAVRVLHGVSIEVREGETVALLGTNGNGKSTLIKCIMGMVSPEAGEVFLETDGTRAHDAHHAFHQRALAVAVGAEQHHGLAGLDVERHVLEHAHVPVGGVDLLDGEAIGQDTPSPPRDRE